jgi:beta-mannosidase
VWHQKHPFSDYNRYISRFMSEYGFQSFPEYHAVKQYTLPEDENIESPVMSSHQRSGIGNLRIREYMDQDYRIPEKFDDFLYVSQLLQAEGIVTAIHAHRKNKPYCMGTLYWQLNDCWPVASWSSTDYYRNYKALHYQARKAFEPVVVIASQSVDLMEFRVVSDRREPVQGTLRITTISLDGKMLHTESLPFSAEPLSNQVVQSLPLATLTGGHPGNDLAILVELVSGDKTLEGALHYLVRPKELKLTRPEIKSSVSETATDWLITISSDRLAKNLMVTFEGRAGIFSDNYVDVIPGKPEVIKLSKRWSATRPDGKLAFKSLADTY